MKNLALIFSIVLLSLVETIAQSKTQNTNQMEKKTINPWKWSADRSYVQAVEVKQQQGTLYVSGQTATDDNGISSKAEMKDQLILAINNLEKVITDAGYESKNIVRLNIYTTSSEEFFANFIILQKWISKHEIKQASTLLEVNTLFETLKVELEATVVK